jgi:aquaporin Z
MLWKRLAAEAIGTFWLVLGGVGSAVLASSFVAEGNSFPLGIGLTGVSLAFGLTVVTGAYAFAAISGAHFNPAITVGLWASRKFETAAVLPYVAAQVVGGILGAGVVYAIASGQPGGYELSNGSLAVNGYDDWSPGHFNLASGMLVEVVLTAMFVLVILGVTSKRAPIGFAALAIGLTLTLIHLISIPVTNTSVNPARSTGPAVFVGEAALTQLWLFWLAPLVGGIVAGVAWRVLFDDDTTEAADAA